MRYRATRKPLPQVARELGGVDYVLEGSVRRSGNHVGVNAQLFRTRDQASLWAETYESGVADVLTIQNNVAGQIARAQATGMRSSVQLGRRTHWNSRNRQPVAVVTSATILVTRS